MNDFEVLPIATPERDQPNAIPNEERRRRPNENAQPKARDVIIGIYERRLADGIHVPSPAERQQRRQEQRRYTS